MYRMIFNPALENMSVDDFDREYDDLGTAKAVMEAIADYTLMLHSASLMKDYTNYGYIDEWKDGDWVEVE